MLGSGIAQGMMTTLWHFLVGGSPEQATRE